MSPWLPKIITLAACLVLMTIRGPYGQRSKGVKVARSFRSTTETVMLTIAWIGFFVPLLWIFSPIFRFADLPEHSLLRAPLIPIEPWRTFSPQISMWIIPGTVFLAFGLWLFYRSHKDLGTNWSITLELREQHTLVTRGVYTHIRHPMYSALLLYSLGQMLVIPNWIAGPAYLIAMLLLFAFRFRAEERMMLEQFGDAYRDYMKQTKRIVPGIW